MKLLQVLRAFRLREFPQTGRVPWATLPSATVPLPQLREAGAFPINSALRLAARHSDIVATSVAAFPAEGAMGAPCWFRKGAPGALGTIRCSSGGKSKGGENAKEKRIKRLLRKLNTNAANQDEPEARETGYPKETGETRRGGARGGGLEGFDVAAAAAQQQMQKQLEMLESRLKEFQVTRPQLDMFERIQVHIAGGTTQLAELGQVVIRGTSLVRLTLFSEQHLSKVVSALRKTDESWAIVEEGPTTVRVQLPRMSEELRSTFVTKAKAATEECKVQIRRVRQEARSKLHSLWEHTKGGEENMKREKEQQLQKLTDDAIKRASSLLNDKLKQLAAPIT